MNENTTHSKTIGIWISEKKSQKLNWKEFRSACNSHGYNLVKLDLERRMEDQGRIDVFIHKLTDTIAAADQGDAKAASVIANIEQYLSNHPNIIVIDKLDNVRILLNRYEYYTILQEELSVRGQGVFTPTFAELVSTSVHQNLQAMRRRGVSFPAVCKRRAAHGGRAAHEMVLVRGERALRACAPPCLLQTFVGHSALLHKVFLVGNRYHICKRPSLKNFYASDDLEPIFYRTGDVCKADSQSTLSILDPQDRDRGRGQALDEDKIKAIIRILRRRIGLLLVGFDVVIENSTGRHAVIDINVFPSYDSFPNFFEHLLESIEELRAGGSNDAYSNGQYIDYYQDDNQPVNGLLNVGDDCGPLRVKGMNIN